MELVAIPGFVVSWNCKNENKKNYGNPVPKASVCTVIDFRSIALTSVNYM